MSTKSLYVYNIQYEWVNKELTDGVSSSFTHITNKQIKDCYEVILEKLCNEYKFITYKELFSGDIDVTIKLIKVIVP